tara:strand:- start:663 stop:854 length:192 start_codon:yes stop_codon:yes gene_type:complete
MVNTKLKTLLMEREISQMKLSHAIQVDPAQISKIIRGWEKPTDEIKMAISNYLGVDEKVLFSN